MSFKTLREKHLLSQEKLSEISGVGLRTVQRLEAGHRVSYASLRTLALALKMDVDGLERDLYAMPAPAEEFIEVPRWVRRLRAGLVSGARARRQAVVGEAFAIGLGLAFLLASLFTAPGQATATLRVAGAFALLVGYGVSVATRVVDRYRGWEHDDAVAPGARGTHHRLALYAFAVLLPVLFLWLVVRLA